MLYEGGLRVLQPVLDGLIGCSRKQVHTCMVYEPLKNVKTQFHEKKPSQTQLAKKERCWGRHHCGMIETDSVCLVMNLYWIYILFNSGKTEASDLKWSENQFKAWLHIAGL